MTTHDFLAVYDAKVTEYLLALTYLLLFVPMWRFVHGGARAAVSAHAAAEADTARAEAAHAAAVHGWFTVPEGVALHAGHAWARLGDDGLVTVGIDDFAQKLVAPENLVLPRTGDHVLAGRPAFAIGDQVVTVPMLSPVEGEVVAVNQTARERPEILHDPYGAGWLFKVKAPEGLARAQLMVGEAARAFLDRTAEALALRVSPELGHVLQDGGAPIHGLARALAGEGWTALALRELGTER
jgi:glycine cleavage system H lipoate-binding protein